MDEGRRRLRDVVAEQVNEDGDVGQVVEASVGGSVSTWPINS